jgi:beta-glucosidase
MDDGRIIFEIQVDNEDSDLKSPLVLKPNRRYHLAASYDGSLMRIYLDGVLCIEEAVKTPGNLASNATLLCIGNQIDRDRPYSGSMYSVAIFDKALSIGRIRAHTKWSGDFPPNFLWGAATAAYQAEGGITANDWEYFTTTPLIVDRVHFLAAQASPPEDFNLIPANEAVHHADLRMLAQDLDRCQELGLNCYRFSVEWSRIEPAKGEIHLEVLESYYVQVVRLCQERGLEPIVTLHHLTFPLWVCTPPALYVPGPTGEVIPFPDYENSLKGWINPQVIDVFIAFVQLIVQRLTQEGVRYWITINEPVGSVIAVGYLAGVWPPGFVGDGIRAKIAYFNVIKAHVKAYDVIKAINPTAMVSIAHNMSYCKVYPGPSPIFGDHTAARNQLDYFYHYHFLDSVTSGRVDMNIKHLSGDRLYQNSLQFFGIPEEDWRPKLDFIGVNYYRAIYARHDDALAILADFAGGIPDKNYKDAPQLLTQLGWEIYPQGLYEILKKLHDDYDLPILITENGIGEKKDDLRSQYILAYLKEIVRAVSAEVKVLGYIHWSIVDNFEWAYQYDPHARFGLYFVERSARDNEGFFPRIIKRGGLAFQKAVLTEDIDETILEYGTISSDGIDRMYSEPTQSGWRWCKICQGLHYAPTIFDTFLSRCPSGGTHLIGAATYSLTYNLTDNFLQKSGWRKCDKCLGIYYGEDNTNSICPAGGTHASAESLDYSLQHEFGNMVGRQENWQQCIKCQGLFFGLNITASKCPAGGNHEHEEEPYNYSLLTDS